MYYYWPYSSRYFVRDASLEMIWKTLDMPDMRTDSQKDMQRDMKMDTKMVELLGAKKHYGSMELKNDRIERGWR